MDFPQLTFQRVTDENLQELGRVHSIAWQDSHKGIVSDQFLLEHTPQHQTELFQTELYCDNLPLYLAGLDHQSVGMISLNLLPEPEHPEVGEIRSIYLLPQYCGQGLGKYIMDFGVRSLAGKRQIYLWVMNRNMRARRFYEKYGFEYSGIQNMLSAEKEITEMKYRLNL